MDALKLAAAGFTTELLPIIPVDAAISSHSRAGDNLLASRGKVPGRRTSEGDWVGFANWTGLTSSLDECRRWTAWGCGVGMQGRIFPGVDIDVEDSAFARAVHAAAVAELGLAPARFGRGERRLLVYRGRGLRKRRVAFRAAVRGPAADADTRGLGAEGAGHGGGADGVLDQADRLIHAVEFLGDGQQYVVAGLHPKTGKPYRWEDGDLLTYGPEGLTEITDADLDRFFAAVMETAEGLGFEVVTQSQRRGPGGDVTVWSGSLLAPSVGAIERALKVMPNEVDYDTWLKVAVAVKAAGGEDAEEVYPAWEDWSLKYPGNTPELTRDKWDSFSPPYQTGWPWLAALARQYGFRPAAEEFDPVAPPTPLEKDEAERAAAEAATDMFKRCAWVDDLERIADLSTLRLMNRTQFNAEYWMVGDPASPKECAWAVFMRQGGRRRTVRSVTYRPKGSLFFPEPGKGMCLNLWQGAEPLPDEPGDPSPWLRHVAIVAPSPGEADVLLDWLAWVVQHPDLKPNWAVVIGSPAQGLGKSMLLEPVRRALGKQNVKEVGPLELTSGFTDWLSNIKLFIVEEMMNFDRRDVMNRLKNYLATPPHYLQINPKFAKPYEIPNLVAGVFFTNHGNALPLERTDRRFFVIWNESEPQPAAYYRELAAWYDNGGREAAAAYLRTRDVSRFDPYGRAPGTEAKDDMRKAGRGLVEEWLEDGVADELGVFAADLVSLEDVWGSLPDAVCRGGRKPTLNQLGRLLKQAGARDRGRLRLSEGVRQRLYSLRRHEIYASADLDRLRRVYQEQRAKAGNTVEFG